MLRIGPKGAMDHFSCNYEIGDIEFDRIIEEEKPDGWYIIGTSGFGNELHTRARRLNNGVLSRIA